MRVATIVCTDSMCFHGQGISVHQRIRLQGWG